MSERKETHSVKFSDESFVVASVGEGPAGGQQMEATFQGLEE